MPLSGKRILQNFILVSVLHYLDRVLKNYCVVRLIRNSVIIFAAEKQTPYS